MCGVNGIKLCRLLVQMLSIFLGLFGRFWHLHLFVLCIGWSYIGIVFIFSPCLCLDFNDVGGYGSDGYIESGVWRGPGRVLVGKGWFFYMRLALGVGLGLGYGMVFVLVVLIVFFTKLLRDHEN